MSDPIDAPPTHCFLGHRLFGRFEQLIFRRLPTDATPVIVVQLGEREAVIPLRSIQREFGITDASADGQMLALIAEALDFVPSLRIGDPLPSEVLTGAASWRPDPDHLRRALMRLQLQLVGWLRGETGAEPLAFDAEALARADSDPIVRHQIQEAFQRAAAHLGLSSKDAVVAQLESLAGELAYIEALRERLLDRVRLMTRRIDGYSRTFHGDVSQRGSLERLRFLSAAALRQLSGRFAEQDAQAGEVMAVLRHLDNHRGFIRCNRDWLYRTQIAWEPLLSEWDKTPHLPDEDHRTLLTLTYQFLAPQFMPVTDWLKANKGSKRPELGRRMPW